MRTSILKRSSLLFALILPLVTARLASQQPAHREVTAASDTAWHDLTFDIEQTGKLSDGAYLLRAAGTYRTVPVALAIVLSPTWKEGRLGSGVPLVTYTGTVKIRSLGEQSDHLLTAIDQVYGTALHPHSMSRQTEFTAITLGGNPTRLIDGPVKIKLFFESDDESRYAELYLNIDVGATRLELAEKDPDYRRAIVRALSRP